MLLLLLLEVRKGCSEGPPEANLPPSGKLERARPAFRVPCPPLRTPPAGEIAGGFPGSADPAASYSFFLTHRAELLLRPERQPAKATTERGGAGSGPSASRMPSLAARQGDVPSRSVPSPFRTARAAVRLGLAAWLKGAQQLLGALGSGCVCVCGVAICRSIPKDWGFRARPSRNSISGRNASPQLSCPSGFPKEKVPLICVRHPSHLHVLQMGKKLLFFLMQKCGFLPQLSTPPAVALHTHAHTHPYLAAPKRNVKKLILQVRLPIWLREGKLPHRADIAVHR